MSRGDERRRHPRYDVSGLAGVLDGFRAFEALKLSAGGMLIRLPVELELDQPVSVELAVGEDTFRSRARVVFLGPDAERSDNGEERYRVGLAFDGPSQFRVDLALSKRFRFLDRYAFEVKGEAFNLTNTPSFFRGDIDINSTTFGRLTSVNVASRVIQLSARFDF